MSILPYPVMCYGPACNREAIYKIAARWSDGITSELKTYHLACADCLPSLFRDAKQKRDHCRLAIGETLEVPGIYRLHRGARDQQLERSVELERELVKRETPSG